MFKLVNILEIGPRCSGSFSICFEEQVMITYDFIDSKNSHSMCRNNLNCVENLVNMLFITQLPLYFVL